MSMTNQATPTAYFERAKAICGMIVSAQEDLRQLREDALDALINDATPKAVAKETRKDLAEVFSLAMIEAKSNLPKSVEKITRRIRIAEEVGMQLTFLDDLQNTVKLAVVSNKATMQ